MKKVTIQMFLNFTISDKIFRNNHIFKSLFLHAHLAIYLAERLMRCSCEQKVPCSIPRLGISVEVTSQC